MIAQGTEAWLQQRAGKISASNISKVMAGGKGITRGKHIAKLALERITGSYIPDFKFSDADRGNILEPKARQKYEEINFVGVELEGFVVHPNIPNSGASPDGLVGDDGLIEIKTRDYHIQFDFIRTGTISDENMKQMQFQMAVTGRKWCDYVSYMAVPEELEDKIPEHLLIKTVRVERDDQMIKQIEAAVRQADAEIEAMVKELKGVK